MPAIYPVILCGGSGTRLWPLSRSMYPKQFIRFLDDHDGSFLAETLARLPQSEGFAAPRLFCNNDHRFLVRSEVQAAGIDGAAIVLEPVARNTAAPIAAAAAHVVAQDPDGVIAVMPSDHAIIDREAFARSVERAAEIARDGRLVLFGIEPTSPHTGYGYIRRGASMTDAGGNTKGAYQVSTFTEKPDAETAQAYIDQGDYYWNAGIFVLHAKTFLEELGRLQPEILAAVTGALETMSTDLEFARLGDEAFAASPNISIDYAVMERTDKAAVMPLDIGWSDVGAWSSLWELAPRDAQGNAVQGDAIMHNASNCFVHSQKALVAAIGVDDLVIVDTPDAILVADKAQTQDVSKVVAKLKESGRKEHEQHLRNHRPWGFFETLAVGPRFQVKKLHVIPGGKLSLQMHHHRSEHWVVVQGTAQVTVGEEEKLVRENESVYISATQWHRLENPGKVPLEIIEVQNGSYLGEDDIERRDDIYKRAADETK